MFFAYTPDGRRWAYADGVWSWIDSNGGQVPCVSTEADQRDAVLEEAAQVCDVRAKYSRKYSDLDRVLCEFLANRIRALKRQSAPMGPANRERPSPSASGATLEPMGWAVMRNDGKIETEINGNVGLTNGRATTLYVYTDERGVALHNAGL